MSLSRVYYFLFAIFLHCFLFMLITVHLFLPQKPPRSPYLAIPSYLYEPPSPPVQASQKSLPPEKMTQEQGFSKALPQTLTSQSMVHPASKRSDPVHLLGDKKVNQPLIKLLGRAIASKLIYPKIAVDFNLRGTAYVQFIVHPDGTVSDVVVIKSSGTQVLDQAALTAVKEMPIVKSVNKYINEAKQLVVGVIFK